MGKEIEGHGAVGAGVGEQQGGERECVGVVVAEDEEACGGEVELGDVFGEGEEIGGALVEEAVGGVEEDDVGGSGGTGGGEPLEEVGGDDARAVGEAQGGDVGVKEGEGRAIGFEERDGVAAAAEGFKAE